MYLNRHLAEKILNYARYFPVVAISGARQVGKSTMLKHILGKRASYFEFDPLIDLENARKDPDLFLDHHTPPLILDEIQYAPELIAAIKRRIDKNKKPGQYFLSGSQQWQVMKSLSESLSGRVVFADLEPFSISETLSRAPESSWLCSWLNKPGQSFSRMKLKYPLLEQIYRGFLPEAQFIPLEVIPAFQQGYERTYIERDVRIMAELSNFSTFSLFYRLMAALTAQEINFHKLGRELGLTPQTAKRWLDILKSTFQWFEIPAFHGNTIKKLSGKPKGYFMDPGLAVRALAITNPASILSHPQWGALFETFIAAEIRKQLSLLDSGVNVYHWRAHSGTEVDFIIEKDGVSYPIEVKAKSHPTLSDTSGISAFRKTYPHLNIGKGLIIAPAESFHPLSKNDFVMPWDSLA